ncbi:unnamed protein product [Euphydryas editha]|uniref:Peptidase S1 domain-containing protein n=1 Tax=Euphydryas editha TaxID=104508 RepID=A0AAU9TWW0_EUPED|nr:unnamed protein product [Euphydryas editha]
MSLKAGFLFVTLLILLKSHALPLEDNKKDMSIFFDHTDSSSRVVGGTNAGIVPYMVALSSGVLFRNFVCGGSLVTTRHVLTAAHCVEAVLFGDNVVGSLRGIVGTDRWNTRGTMYRFSRHVIHPEYNAEVIKNDIGILITATDVVLSDRVSLISLNFNFVNAGVPTTVTGWGITRLGIFATVSQHLMRLNAVVVDGYQCAIEVAQRAAELEMWNAPPVDPEIELCAFNSNGRGMCNGDSGSPLMRADLNQQIGIVSWGLPCAQGAPDMFVRLSTYKSWVENNIS